MPFGLSATYSLAIPSFADLDNDGDMDLLVAEQYANMQYFENLGTAEAPSFEAPQQNPFGLSTGYGISAPEFGDFDNDGDQDIVVGAYYGNLEYYLNTGTDSTPNFFGPATNPFGLTQTYEFAFPSSSIYLENTDPIDPSVYSTEGLPAENISDDPAPDQGDD